MRRLASAHTKLVSKLARGLRGVCRGLLFFANVALRRALVETTGIDRPEDADPQTAAEHMPR